MQKKTWQQKWNSFLLSKYPTIIWFALAFLSALSEVLRAPKAINNYLIFKGVFWHIIAEQKLYGLYPEQYADSNYYGPVFSIVIAPFAILPDFLGGVLWTMANAFLLYKAIALLPLDTLKKNTILFFCSVELATSSHNLQSNPMVAAFIILSYVMVLKGKEFWACLFIMLGFYIKIYGIVAAVFWLFSDKKIRFIFYCVFWGIILFCLPMLISSPSFIAKSYSDWAAAIQAKNQHNVIISPEAMQDVSVLGMVKRIFNWHEMSNIVVIAPALLFYAFSLFRYQYYRLRRFQMLLVSSTLLFVVLFSTGSESATYIIAMADVLIWFATFEESAPKWAWYLLAFALLFTSLSATDLMPHFIKTRFIRPFALKALPCFLVWCVVIFQMITFKFKNDSIQQLVK